MNKDDKNEVFDTKTYVRKLFVRQLVIGVLLGLIALLVFKSSLAAVFMGLFAGWGDNLLVLRGVQKGMEKEMASAARYMHGTMLSRLGLLVTAVVLGIYLGLTAYSVFIGYIFMHIALLGNMILIARQNKS